MQQRNDYLRSRVIGRVQFPEVFPAATKNPAMADGGMFYREMDAALLCRLRAGG